MRNRIRVLRAEHHLSQAELAEHLNVARQTVHALETGKFAPSLILAFKIATLFEADINDVFAPDAEDTLPSLLDPTHTKRDGEADAARHRRASRPLVFFGKPRA